MAKVAEEKKEKKEVIIDCPCQKCVNVDIDVHRMPCSECWKHGMSTGCFEHFRSNEMQFPE